MNPRLIRILWTSTVAKGITDPKMQFAYLCAIAGIVDEIMER